MGAGLPSELERLCLLRAARAAGYGGSGPVLPRYSYGGLNSG